MLIGTLLLSPTSLQAAITFQIVLKDTQATFFGKDRFRAAPFFLSPT